MRWIASPLALFLLLAAVVLMTKKNGDRRRSMALLCLVFALMAMPLFGKLTMSAVEALAPQDVSLGHEAPVYLVLAGGAWRDGESWQPSSATVRRLRRALSALSEREGLLLLSGIESALMVRWLHDHGVDVPVLREKSSRTTEENLRFSADLIDRQGLSKRQIVLVTDRFHMKRALMWARHLMPQVEVTPLAASSITSTLRLPWDLLPSLKGLEYTSLAWRELVALGRDWLFILVREMKKA